MRYPAVRKTSGHSQSALKRKIAAGEFTSPIEISERAVGIPQWEVAAINAARISGQSTAEIKKLVKHLMAARAWAKYFLEWPTHQIVDFSAAIVGKSDAEIKSLIHEFEKRSK